MREISRVSVKAAFTLIELLVVIAIIGVLSAIVLGNLQSSKVSAADAAVKLAISEARSQIELDGSQAGNYGVTFGSKKCPTTSSPPDPIFYTDTRLQTILASVNANNGNRNAVCATGGPAGAATSWAVASSLQGQGSQFGPWWCADSTGISKLSREKSHGWLAYLELLVTPRAHAVSLYSPPLGGGAATAQCP